MVLLERFFLACIVIVMVGFVYILETYINPYLFTLISFVFIIGYLGFLISRRKNKPLNHGYGGDGAKKPFVTVMIAEKNEINVIPDTIKNLSKLEYPKELWELIIVDDNSTDGTYEHLLSVDWIIPIHKPQEKGSGKPAALNVGLQQAKGEYVLVLDADARLRPDFLDKIVAELIAKRKAKPSIRAIQAIKRVTNREDNFLTECQDNELVMDAMIASARAEIDGGSELRGNGMMIEKAALEEIGNFTMGVLTDDLDLSTKLHLAGYDVAISHTPVFEEAVLAFRVLFKQRVRWAEGSLRRYLQYLPEVLDSKKITFAKKIDITIFFVEFLFPMMLILDLLYNLFTLHIPGLIAFTLAVIIFMSFWLPFIISSKGRGFEKMSESFASAVYMCHWLPVISYVIFLVLTKKGPSNWVKTPHQNR